MEFQSSIKNSRTIAEYDAVREKLWAMFTPDMFGDPEATSEALFKVVDADEPPLRLVIGSSFPPHRSVRWLSHRDFTRPRALATSDKEFSGKANLSPLMET